MHPVCSRSGREELQQLIRQLNRLRQTNSVAEYAKKFNELMHNPSAHHASWNPVFFIAKFVDGLPGDIRSAVVLHRPQDLDTAIALVAFQEEVLEAMRKDPRRGEMPSGARSVLRTALPLPLPLGKKTPITRADDRRGTEGARGTPFNDKLIGLRAYKCAKGLCHTCVERWSHDHKCGPTVQLHVVEEL